MSGNELLDSRAAHTVSFAHRQLEQQVHNVNVSDHGRVHLGDVHTHHYNNVPDRAKDKRREVTQKLSFPEMNSRCENIAEEHEGTCEWIFAEKSANKGWTTYNQWIESDEPVYWISGKPGSGKLVLMKYSHTSLRDEADENTLVLSYWFWEAGTALQQSYIGCLRALLCQLLEDPRTASISAAQEKVLMRSSLPPLRKMREIICEMLKAGVIQGTSVRILLEGLDEAGSCAGDIVDMVEKMSEMIPRIKICVSSRPEQLFKARLSQHQNLSLQDFNQADIEKVIDDELFNKSWISQQLEDEPDKKNALRRTILEKSAGVFLWVRLAIRHIELGVTNRDTLDMIEDRLEALPADLDSLYGAMLARNGHNIQNCASTSATYFTIMLHYKYRPPFIDDFCLWVDYQTRRKLLETPVLVPGAEVAFLHAGTTYVTHLALAAQACYKCPRFGQTAAMGIAAVCPVT